MSNLTFDHQLLKEHTPEPLEGHAVVVFARVGEAGDELHSVLHPGAAPVKPGLPLPFVKRTEYFAYAADTAPERHLDFSESMRLADHVSEFRVIFHLAYAVSDPRALARARNADPLRKVRDQVRVVIKREVEQLPWQAVWEAFPHHAREVVDDSMEELSEFAARYGLVIRGLRLTVRLPEAMESDLTAIQRSPLVMRRQAADGAVEVQSALIKSGVSAVENGDLVSAGDMLRHVPGFQGGTGGLGLGPAASPGMWPGTGYGAQPGLAPGMAPGMAPRALAAGTPGGGGLASILGDVVAATDAVRVSGQKRALRAALLHLVAEMLVDDLGDGGPSARAAERARGAIGKLDPPPAAAELDLLKTLGDPEALRRRLDN